MSPLGGGHLAGVEEAEIWEGSPEEQGFPRVRPWELQSRAEG